MKNLFKITLLAGALFTGAFVFYKFYILVLRFMISAITGLPIENIN